ncbi:hypothetical protein FB45DRAFT_917246 [Roridomyces roridus]|uniref:Uncharacterized protein n=1 Tax=Roridomyces roridus TaxID=1738132 RepID=A0AAD7FLE3_9AGAR|nr:hypothetical protein FB45DRAFT_917246 [Roridomyces roridus]
MQGGVSTLSDLLAFVIPLAPLFPDSTKTGRTWLSSTSWSGSRRPPQDDFLSFSFLEARDDSIYEEIMRRGTEELARRNFLNRPLPSNLVYGIDNFVEAYVSHYVDNERDLDAIIGHLTCAILYPLLKWITADEVELCGVQVRHWADPWQGINMVAVPVSRKPGRPESHPEPLRSFALESEMPTVPISNAKDLHQENDFTYQRQSGGRAMLANLFLHISAVNKEPNIGVLFDGWTIRICQKIRLINGHWAMAISEGRPTTLEQTHPPHAQRSPEFPMWKAHSNPIPLIGLFLCLLLPGSPLRTPQVPDSVLAKAKAISPTDLLQRKPTIEKRDKDGTGSQKHGHLAFIPEDVVLHIQRGPILSSSSDSATSALPRLEALTMLSIGCRATVWSGKFMGEPVKIKFYDLDDGAQEALATEKACYERLSALGLTPPYYGVYRGEECALVLGDGGKALEEWSFSELDDTDKDALYTLVKQVHAAGVRHLTLEPHHVVRGPQGSLRLIDFAQSVLEHYCDGTCDELQRLWAELYGPRRS